MQKSAAAEIFCGGAGWLFFFVGIRIRFVGFFYLRLLGSVFCLVFFQRVLDQPNDELLLLEVTYRWTGIS